MPDNDVAFENLKKNIIKESEGSFDIESVKECFSVVINSRRSLSRVKNLKDIFHLLEQRDLLDYNNVCTLEHLANLLQNESICQLIKGYKKLYIDSECCICGENISDVTLPIINPQNSLENKKHDGKYIFLISFCISYFCFTFFKSAFRFYLMIYFTMY